VSWKKEGILTKILKICYDTNVANLASTCKNSIFSIKIRGDKKSRWQGAIK
jgi:hypothetical protein